MRPTPTTIREAREMGEALGRELLASYIPSLELWRAFDGTSSGMRDGDVEAQQNRLRVDHPRIWAAYKQAVRATIACG